MIKSVFFFFLSVCLLLVVGCATHTGRMRGIFDEITQGKTDEALARLEKLAKEPSRDQLLHQLEYATLLQIMGRFAEASQEFIKADRLADAVDYYSISNMALAAVTSEEMLQYKVTSHESLLINVHAVLSFMQLGKMESALVEVRRMQDKVNKIRQTAREDYEFNPFSHFLGGLLWEAQGRFDEAAISYEKAYELDPGIPTIAEDLIRTNWIGGREQKLQHWKKKFPKFSLEPRWRDRGYGELVILVAQGLGPEKVPNPESPRFPVLRPRSSATRFVEVRVLKDIDARKANKVTSEPKILQTKVAYDSEQAAIRAFNADLNWMVARRLGAFAAKEVVADQIRQKNEVLGAIARIGMHLAERPDLRQWTTLPQTFQVARVYLPIGTYRVDMQGQPVAAGNEGPQSKQTLVEIKSRQKTILYWRPLN